MVEGVESIEPELDEQCLPYGKVLLQREIGVEEVRTECGVPAYGANLVEGGLSEAVGTQNDRVIPGKIVARITGLVLDQGSCFAIYIAGSVRRNPSRIVRRA